MRRLHRIWEKSDWAGLTSSLIQSLTLVEKLPSVACLRGIALLDSLRLQARWWCIALLMRVHAFLSSFLKYLFSLLLPFQLACSFALKTSAAWHFNLLFFITSTASNQADRCERPLIVDDCLVWLSLLHIDGLVQAAIHFLVYRCLLTVLTRRLLILLLLQKGLRLILF